MWRRTLLQARLHLPRVRHPLTAAACQPIEQHGVALLTPAHATHPPSLTAIPPTHLLRWMTTGQDGTGGSTTPDAEHTSAAAVTSALDAIDDAPPADEDVDDANDHSEGDEDEEEDDDEEEEDDDDGSEAAADGQTAGDEAEPAEATPSGPKEHIVVTRRERRFLSRYLPAFESKGILDEFFRSINTLSREEFDLVTTFSHEELRGEVPLSVGYWTEDEDGEDHWEEVIDDGTIDDEEFEEMEKKYVRAYLGNDYEAPFELTDKDWRFIAWDNCWDRLIKFSEAPSTPPELRAKARQLLKHVDEQYAKLRRIVEKTGKFPIRDPVHDPPSDTDDDEVVLPEVEPGILPTLMGPVGMGPLQINRLKNQLARGGQEGSEDEEEYTSEEEQPLLEAGSGAAVDDEISWGMKDDESSEEDEATQLGGSSDSASDEDDLSLSSSDEEFLEATDKDYEADSDDLSSDDEALTDFEDEGWNSDEEYWNEKPPDSDEEEPVNREEFNLEEYYPLFVRGKLRAKDSKYHPDRRRRKRYMVYDEYDPEKNMVPVFTGPENGVLVHPYYIDANTGHTMWGYDATGGAYVSPERNALLSDITKREMWLRHTADPVRWSTERLARHYKIREERAIAIVTLKQREEEARQRGEPMMERLAQCMDIAYGAKYSRGTGERHIVKLPLAPKFAYIDPPPGTNLRPGDFISEVDLVETDLAAKQHKTLIAEFKERLEWATWKVGTTLRRGISRHKKAPRKPKEGWSLVVRPLTPGKGDGYGEAFVAKPDGSRRELTSEEAYNLHRQRARRRRKWPNVY